MPPTFTFRAATREDQHAIRRLIYSAHINPMGLDWRRFVLAVDARGQMLACGQLKPHGDGSLELASIAVIPSMRGQGLGSAMVRHLLERAPRPLFLTCRPTLIPYYQRFGFRVAAPLEMPPYFRRLWSLARFFRRNRLVGIMRIELADPS